ncbi:MAG: M60 family metallopeptidase [Clostridia bacterium]|nr:M60 family metallopeptidase [Clostridia bacterium]
MAEKKTPAKTSATAKKAEPVKKTTAAKKTEPAKSATAAKKTVTEEAQTAKGGGSASFAQRKTVNRKSETEVSAALAAANAESPKKKAKAEKAPTMVADKKAEKKKQSVTSKHDDSTSGGARAISLDKNKKIIIICVAVVACLAILLTMILSIRACTSGGKGTYADIFKNTTEVGYSAEYLGEVDRKIPTEMKNGGLAQGYPTYGSTQNLTTEQKNAVIAESWQLCSINTRIGSNGYPKGTYDSMDANGNLYLDGVATGQKLYKHTASVGMYMGDVSDSEPAIVKNITLRHRYSNSYSLTGMYAPAGEVIKIEMSQADMEASGGILVHIGQALYNTKANNIWPARNINRMPVILNSMKVNKDTATYDEKTQTYTAYVGSFLGGPIYIHNTNVTVDVKISGGVRYTHFILGYTTEDEYNENAKSSAPYFDLEVWDGGVLHSGPKKCAGISTYEEVQKAGVLWEKISLVSNYARNKREGIVFLYDPFVAAGAAVAFPGQQSVNCPSGWMSGSLKVDSFIRGGAWGNMHEYNHNFQGYGISSVGGEVTNNALNLVEYSWFTYISSARTIASYGGGGLSGWNCYTSASWAVKQICGDSDVNPGNPLSMYAVLLHNFGQDSFLNTTRTSGTDAYFTAWSETVHQDMTYYAEQIAKVFNGRFGGYPDMSADAKAKMKSKNYPMFVPIASVYQTGRSYNYDGEKKYISTQQPFVIQYGEEFDIDLSRYTVGSGGIYQSGSVVIPERFSYTVKSVAAQDGQKINGTLKKVDDMHYTFTPNKEILSGKIIATLEIKDTQGEYTNIDNVDLILEFEQSHEMNKNVVQRTTYTYADGEGYTDAVAAYEAGYAGYAQKIEGDNINRTQNSNTDVWYTNQEGDVVPKNGIVEIKGKLQATADGKYRIAVRGRWNIALYIKVNDAKEYILAASSKTDTGTNINDANKVPHYDLELKKDDWVYFKEVLVTSMNGNRASFIGLGFNKFEDPMPILDANGDPLLDGAGNPIETPETISLSYAVGYREDYEEIEKHFTSEYHYKREYTYNYNYNYMYNDKQSLYGDMVNYVPWANNYELYAPEHLVDGDLSTFIHTQTISPQKPFIFTIDMGKEITANRMYVNTQSRADYRYPKDFRLLGSLDGEKFFEIGSFTDVPIISNNRIVVDFELTTFRYYQMIITKSSNNLIIINRIDFMEHYEQLGGAKYSIDNEMFKYGGKWSSQSTTASFGHVAVGQKGATVEFTFEGNRLALLSSSLYGKDFEVTIDGKTVTSDPFKNLAGERTVVSFMSPEIAQGKHKVKVKCKKKNCSIDSFVFWQAAETE